MDTRSKIYLSWNDVEWLITTLSTKIQTRDQFNQKIETIYGCPRGGLIPAVMLSHRLNLPLIVDENQINKNTLIVDDICDSGKTFLSMYDKYIEGYEPEDVPEFACLHYKFDTSDFTPDFFGAEIRGFNGWFVYPWETKNSEAIQDYLK